MPAASKYPTATPGAANSPAGPTEGFLDAAAAGAGSFDVSAHRGRFVRVQSVNADTYVWFAATSTSSRRTTDATTLTAAVPLLVKDGTIEHFMVPGFGSEQTSFLHYEPASGTPDVHVVPG